MYRSEAEEPEPEGVTLEEFPWYVVCRNGQIWSKCKRRYMKASGKKYLRLKLIGAVDGETPAPKIDCAVHRLVAKAFCPNPNGYMYVDHLDSNTKNNAASNLEWVTSGENIKRSHAKPGRKSTCRPILQYTKSGEFIKEFPGVLKASEETNINQGSLWRALNGKTKTAGTYTWKYKTLHSNRKKRVAIPGEVWKPHPKHKKCEVSSLGRVFSNKSNTILTQSLNSSEYYTATVDGSPRLVHRLVVETFIGEAPEDMSSPVVNHKDNNKLNNRLDNLEWLSTSDNVKDAYAKGLSSITRQCVQYTLKGVKVAEFVSCQEAERTTGAKGGSISLVCDDAPKYKTAGGYVWCWKGDPFDRGDGEYKPSKGGVPRGCVQYTVNGEFVAEYPSLEAASKVTGADVKNLGRVCRDKTRRDGTPKLSGGSVWRYKGEAF
jgi:HNH endonuclease/NUMOD1 domain